MYCGTGAGVYGYSTITNGFSSAKICGTEVLPSVSVPIPSQMTSTVAVGFYYKMPPYTGFKISWKEQSAGCNMAAIIQVADCGQGQPTCSVPTDAIYLTDTFNSQSAFYANYCRNCASPTLNTAGNTAIVWLQYAAVGAGLSGSPCTAFTLTPYNMYQNDCPDCPSSTSNLNSCPPAPTLSPTLQPSLQPTLQPTPVPSFAPSAAPTAAPSSSPDPNATASQGAASTSNNTGVIIGAVVGVLVVGGAGYFFYNQKQALAKQAAEKSTAGLDTSNKI